MRRRTREEIHRRHVLADLFRGDDEREQAIRRDLKEMPDDKAVELLLAWLKQVRRSMWLFPLFYICAGFAGAATIVAVDRALGRPVSWAGSPGGFVGQTFGFALAYLSHARARRRLYTILSGYDDLRALGPLAGAEASLAKNGKRLPGDPLIRILQSLRPGDALALTSQTRGRLGRLLLESRYKPLALAIIRAMEQVGDEQATGYVERLSKGDGALGYDPEVRHAAAMGLPAIRQAAERNAVASTLLRASGESTDFATLLHPAHTRYRGVDTLVRIPEADSQSLIQHATAEDESA